MSKKIESKQILYAISIRVSKPDKQDNDADGRQKVNETKGSLFYLFKHVSTRHTLTLMSSATGCAVTKFSAEMHNNNSNDRRQNSSLLPKF